MIIDDDLTEDRWLNADTWDEAAWMARCVWRDMQQPSPRKSQLFTVACAREIWHLLVDERSRQGVEVAERYLEGQAPRSEIDVAAERAVLAYRTAEDYSSQFWACIVAGIATRPLDNRFNDWKVPNAMRFLGLHHPGRAATLLRDIFGNPFHPVTIPSPIFAWHDGTIPKLALAAYDNRQLPSGHLDPSLLAVLADALEEAGCQDAEVLGHLRSEGPHVRGCWAVDLLLGKS